MNFRNAFGIDLTAYRDALIALAEAGKAPIRAFLSLFHRMSYGDRRKFGRIISAFMRVLGFPRQIGFETVIHPDGSTSKITIFGR